MISFGSVNGTLTALAFFAVIFATLGWGVGRAMARRTQPVRGRLGWTVGVLLFAGPLLAVYATSFGGFYGAQVRDSTLHLRYLVPGTTRDIPRADIQSSDAKPWQRGKGRLAIITTGGARYESAADSQVFIHLARESLVRQLSGHEVKRGPK